MGLVIFTFLLALAIFWQSVSQSRPAARRFHVANIPGQTSVSLQSKGAKEKAVTRVMVSRCEVDLMKIRTEFKKQHSKSLYQTITVSVVSQSRSQSAVIVAWPGLNSPYWEGHRLL